MARKIFTAEQIISKLREAEVLLSQGQPLGSVCRGLEISEQTYYRWRKEYGGLRTDQAHRLKELERENARLKKLVADLALDKAMLQEALAVRTIPMITWAPGRTAEKRHAGPRGIPCLGATGVPGDQDRSLQPAVSRPFRGRGGTTHATDGGAGHAVWTVWLSAHYGVAAAGGLARQP
jgi:putative transposase